MVLTKLVFILKHKEIDILKANEVERWMNCGLNFNLSYNVCSSSWKFKRLTAFLSADIMDNKSIEKRKKYSSRLENRIQIRLEGLEALSTCPSPFPGRPQGACVTSHEETAGRSFPIHVYLLLLSLFSFSLIIFLFSLSYFRSFFRFLLEYLVSLLSLCYANSVECLSLLLERHLTLSWAIGIPFTRLLTRTCLILRLFHLFTHLLVLLAHRFQGSLTYLDFPLIRLVHLSIYLYVFGLSLIYDKDVSALPHVLSYRDQIHIYWKNSFTLIRDIRLS